ncbi:dNA integration/recombination/inversion protein [Clostridium sp. CAG:1193]|nr:dNA integration/recombination/inversion protein [Clostridium sp. CAG:1193]
MAVLQLPKERATKDGRRWYFYDKIKVDGRTKAYMSKSYMTRTESLKAERDFLVGYQSREINVTSMTFKQLYEEFYEYKKDKVKATTLRSYRRNILQLSEFYELKIKDIRLEHYIAWRKRIGNLDNADKTKNGYYKLLKTILNYGTKWHDFNFTSIYNKMEKFNNPNKPPKEMQFYTWEEFKQFISVIDDIKWKALFEVLFFCGLRRGELRGLTWDNIDFFNKELSVVKNVVQEGESGDYIVTTPKTRTSVRTLPVPKRVMKDLHEVYLQDKKQYGFSEKWYVFGDKEPLSANILRHHKNDYTKLAGVKQIRIHDFRHSCASVLINNGASIMIVAKYLGHAKIDETLNTYSHLFKNKMDEIVKTMDNLE